MLCIVDYTTLCNIVCCALVCEKCIACCPVKSIHNRFLWTILGAHKMVHKKPSLEAEEVTLDDLSKIWNS